MFLLLFLCFKLSLLIRDLFHKLPLTPMIPFGFFLRQLSRYISHLKNHLARRRLKIKWNDQVLECNDFPVYLGVTLDRTLSYAEHTRKTKGKTATRNNLLAKLANSSWCTDPDTLRTRALALSYSTAEYCSPVLGKSCYAKKVNSELNNV